MHSLFTYLEYRDFLRDWFEDQKQAHPYMSYRYVGNKVGLDASFLVKVFSKQLHLAPRSVKPWMEFLKLSKRERAYFEHLYAFSKSKKQLECKMLFEKLSALRAPNAHILEADKYDFFKEWYHVVLYELIRFYPFGGDYGKLGAQLEPKISRKKAQESIELLARLGLIERREDGTYAARDASLSAGGKWEPGIVREFQKQNIMLGCDALDTIPKEERDISTVTLSLSRPAFVEARERIAQLRRELLELARNDTDHDDVYQMNFQVFPVTRTQRKP